MGRTRIVSIEGHHFDIVASSGRSFFEVQLIGNLGQDAEMRYTPDGDPVTSFSVACDTGKGLEYRVDSSEKEKSL